MRDIVLTLVIFAGVPFIFSRPQVGILMWSWLGYMSPHRLTWGFAYDMPFAQIVGLVTLFSILISKEPKKMPKNGAVAALIILNIWMVITSLFAFYPEIAWVLAEKVFKIQLMIFITMLVMHTKERIIALVWIITLSIGFFGVKGGVYTIVKGGSGMVLGPPGSFIAGNTTVSLALIMILPLIWFLYQSNINKWIQWGLIGAAVLTVFAIIGSYSRGALVTILAMAVFLWWKSRSKLILALMVLIIVPIMFNFMPEAWFEKMGTIETYEQDSSAMGRINAWWFAFNLTKDYPITGCGFDCFQPGLFMIYAPEPTDYHDAHSNYFQMLGHHGYIGLFLFLFFFWLVWRTGSRVRKKTRSKPEWNWAFNLASMIQVGLVGYAVGGAFLNLAYFDLPYHFAAILILLEQLYRREAEATVKQNTFDSKKEKLSFTKAAVTKG